MDGVRSRERDEISLINKIYITKNWSEIKVNRITLTGATRKLIYQILFRIITNILKKIHKGIPF